MDIIIAIFLAIRNAGIAGRKGYGKWKYGLFTFFGFFMAEMLCIMLLLAYKYTGVFDPKAIMGFLTEELSRQMMILLCGLGAYLLVRFILEKMPDRNIKNNENDKDWLKTFGR